MRQRCLVLSVYITDNHCTPDDGDGKEGERGKNGSPTIYVMRINAASVRPCHAGGRGRDLKIIRFDVVVVVIVVGVVATFSRESRVPSHLLSLSLLFDCHSEMQYAAMVVIPNRTNERTHANAANALGPPEATLPPREFSIRFVLVSYQF